MTDLKALVERIEGAAGPSWELDVAIAEWAAAQRLPLACYGGNPINYDVRLWMERHDWSPSSSLDAAMQLVPEWCFWALNMAGDGSGFDAMCQDDGPVKWTRAATPALALCAASLRARISKGTRP